MWQICGSTAGLNIKRVVQEYEKKDQGEEQVKSTNSAYKPFSRKTLCRANLRQTTEPGVSQTHHCFFGERNLTILRKSIPILKSTPWADWFAWLD